MRGEKRPAPGAISAPARLFEDHEVHDLAVRDQDLEVHARRALRVKSLTAPLMASAVNAVALGGLALFMFREMPWIAWALVVGGALVQVTIVLFAIDGVACAFHRGPVLVFTRDAVWVARVGWIDWEDVKKVVVFRVGKEADIGLVPRDKSFVARLPPLARFSALTAGLPLSGSAVSLPHDGLSVSGAALIDYIHTRYAAELVEMEPPA